ncbi:hypothetical protein, partial [Geomonas paludis]|uniref:hypothetical protein n=1 Tax=Geomonas paludis TaxID=2740185 RepID=UPI001AD89FBA
VLSNGKNGKGRINRFWFNPKSFLKYPPLSARFRQIRVRWCYRTEKTEKAESIVFGLTQNRF